MLFYERHCAPRPPLVPVLLPLRCRRRKRPVRPVPSPSVLLFVVIYRHTTERHPYPSINLSSRRNPLVFTFADCAARPRSHRHNLRQFRDRTRKLENCDNENEECCSGQGLPIASLAILHYGQWWWRLPGRLATSPTSKIKASDEIAEISRQMKIATRFYLRL